MEQTGSRSLDTTCCIAGGGPAGMMLGFLLARAGIDVVVLEKHADFLRDFRGDTVHPSTLEIMHELGLLDRFLRNPHQEVGHLSAQIGGTRLRLADFSRMPTRCKFIALMPQWDFLNFLAGEAKRYPGFRLLMEAEVTGLIEEDGRIAGVTVTGKNAPAEVRAPLTIGADGRHSTVRNRAGLRAENLGAPMDVLWFRLSRRETDEPETFGHAEAGRLMVMLNRGDYWQCAYVIPKGSIDDMKRRGIERFREEVRGLSPFLGDRVAEIGDWDDVKLLTVTVDRLTRWWRPGLLCIGDSAHAMSPIGGVGINLAVQDAVAAANLLARPLRHGDFSTAPLEAVQARRSFPTRATQRLQLAIQNRMIGRLLEAKGTVRAPLALRLLPRLPLLRDLPARLIGIGFRPEHVRTAEAPPQPPAQPPGGRA
ncbi:MAG: FAD-dependent oxidoreductase [Alphaproteobacteria bacterium]|nr:FAD-dependent oxidoreductase [Alphaproteobacteria bacterium]